MSKRKSRREILKIAALAPLAITLGPASASKFFQRGKFLIGVEQSQPTCVKLNASQFTDNWTSVGFTFESENGKQLTGRAIKLPNGKFVAFRDYCEKSNCSVEYVDDLAALSKDFAYDSEIPALACKCHQNVFDIATGAVLSGPSRAHLSLLKTKRCHERVCVILDEYINA